MKKVNWKVQCMIGKGMWNIYSHYGVLVWAQRDGKVITVIETRVGRTLSVGRWKPKNVGRSKKKLASDASTNFRKKINVCNFFLEMVEIDGKWWKIIEIVGKWWKCWKFMENCLKWWKIVYMIENDWKLLENDLNGEK